MDLRRLPFEGPLNFRDLGGYATASGGKTRWGLVYRSDGLHRLTERDLELYRPLGIKVVYDLRSDYERGKSPNPMESRAISLERHVPRPEFEDGSSLQLKVHAETRLRDTYLSVISTAGLLFGEVFTGLAAPDGLPAVFHCAGGKDRTGLTAALLLLWLGVDRETVLDDYELTGRWLTSEREEEVIALFVGANMGHEAAKAFLQAPRWVMTEALDFLDSDYGGVEAYLRGPGGMTTTTLDSLREILVERTEETPT